MFPFPQDAQTLLEDIQNVQGQTYSGDPEERIASDILSVFFNVSHQLFQDSELDEIRSERDKVKHAIEIARSEGNYSNDDLASMVTRLKRVNHYPNMNKTILARLRLSLLLSAELGWKSLVKDPTELRELLFNSRQYRVYGAINTEVMGYFNSINKLIKKVAEDETMAIEGQEMPVITKGRKFNRLIEKLDEIAVPELEDDTQLTRDIAKMRSLHQSHAYLMQHNSEALIIELDNIDGAIQHLSDEIKSQPPAAKKKSMLGTLYSTVKNAVPYLRSTSSTADEAGPVNEAPPIKKTIQPIIKALEAKHRTIVLEMLARLEVATLTGGKNDDSLFLLLERFRNIGINVFDKKHYHPRRAKPGVLLAFYQRLEHYLDKTPDEAILARFQKLDIYTDKSKEILELPTPLKDSYFFNAINALLHRDRDINIGMDLHQLIKIHNRWHDLLIAAQAELDGDECDVGHGILQNFITDLLHPLYCMINENIKTKFKDDLERDEFEGLKSFLTYISSMSANETIISTIDSVIQSQIIEIFNNIKTTDIQAIDFIESLENFISLNQYAQTLNVSLSHTDNILQKLQGVAHLIQQAKHEPIRFVLNFTHSEEGANKLLWEISSLSQNSYPEKIVYNIFYSFVLEPSNIDRLDTNAITDEAVEGFFNVLFYMRDYNNNLDASQLIPGQVEAIQRKAIALYRKLRTTEQYHLAYFHLKKVYPDLEHRADLKPSEPKSFQQVVGSYYRSRTELLNNVDRYDIVSTGIRFNEVMTKYRDREGADEFINTLKIRFKDLFNQLRHSLTEESGERSPMEKFFSALFLMFTLKKKSISPKDYILNEVYTLVTLLKSHVEFADDEAFMKFIDDSLAILSLESFEELQRLHSFFDDLSWPNFGLGYADETPAINPNMLNELWSALLPVVEHSNPARKQYLIDFILSDLNHALLSTVNNIINTLSLNSSHSDSSSQSDDDVDYEVTQIKFELDKLLLISGFLSKTKELCNEASYEILREFIEDISTSFLEAVAGNDDIRQRLLSIAENKANINEKFNALKTERALEEEPVDISLLTQFSMFQGVAEASEAGPADYHNPVGPSGMTP